MNILLQEYLPAAGNELTHIWELTSNLRHLGHNIIFMSKGYASYKREARVKPFVLESMKTSMFGSSIFLVELPKFILTFVALLKKHKTIDLVYMRHNIFASGYFLAKLFRVPVVKEVNGIVADEIKISKRGGRISLWVIDRIERFNMPKADRIIVVTSRLKEVLQEDYGVPGDKIIVIQNGANTDLFKPMDVTKARAELGLSRSDNYICFVGSLERWQGVEYLIKSIPLILEQCPETRLLVVGDGQMKQELVELAKKTGVSNNVIFTGMVPYQEVPLYMNASDVCTSPKAGLKSGYSPLKLCEYMACGKPVVASRASGLEIVEDSGGGILVEPEDPRALAAAIIRLLKNQGLRKQMGENGRRYVVENQSWESVAKRVADVCQSLIDSRRNRGEQ